VTCEVRIFKNTELERANNCIADPLNEF